MPTLSVKLEFVVKMPSVTLRVIVELPFCPAAGVTVAVRLVPVPPMTTFAVGTSVVFDEAALTERMAVFSSASPMVTGMAPDAVPCATFCVATALIVGGVLKSLSCVTSEL